MKEFRSTDLIIRKNTMNGQIVIIRGSESPYSRIGLNQEQAKIVIEYLQNYINEESNL